MPVKLENTPGTDSIAITSGLATGTLTNVTVPAGSDRFLLVPVVVEGNGAPGDVIVASATYGGVQLSRGWFKNGPAFNRCELWYLAMPAVGTASVVVNLSAADAFWGFGAYVLSGVSRPHPIKGIATNSGNGTSCSATVPDVRLEDYLVSVVGLDSTGHAHAPGTNETEQIDLACGTGCTLVSSTQSGADGGVMSGSWTTACDFSQVAVALRPAAYIPTNVDFPKHKMRSY